MAKPTLLPDPTCLHLNLLDASEAAITAVVTTTSKEAECPLCHWRSVRIHSRYVREVADLPWMGCAMRLQLHVRRFFCTNPQCARQIFTERLPSVVAPYARRTGRLTDVFTLIGFADRAEKQENAWWQGWACLPAPTRSCGCSMLPRIPLIQRLACWGWMISRFDDGFPLARS